MNTLKRKRLESVEYLASRLEYIDATGQLFWKVLWPGKEAGTLIKKPFAFIKVALERLDFKAHRLAWILYHQSEIPKDMVIDHIDGDATNNAIYNLRVWLIEKNY